jgi:hypothetical protein
MLHNGDTVLEVVDGKIRYHKIEVISTSGERAIVRGLPDGLLLSTKTLNLYNGAEVKIPGKAPGKARSAPEKRA